MPHAGAVNGTNQNGAYDPYFSVPGALPISNTFYNGKFGSYAGSIDQAHGILTRTPFLASYDEDSASSREWTGEVRFQTSFDGPLNFSAGAFFMSFDGRSQYWVASNGLDWESAVIGAFAGTGAGGPGVDLPLMQANPTFDSESRRDATQSRSAFLEATYDFNDELKLIAGARYNDDRTSALTSPIDPIDPPAPVGGGLLLTNGFALVGTPSCTANGGLRRAGLRRFPGTFRLPTAVNGKQNNTTDKMDRPRDHTMVAAHLVVRPDPVLCDPVARRTRRRRQQEQRCRFAGRALDLPAGHGRCRRSRHQEHPVRRIRSRPISTSGTTITRTTRSAIISNRQALTLNIRLISTAWKASSCGSRKRIWRST